MRIALLLLLFLLALGGDVAALLEKLGSAEVSDRVEAIEALAEHPGEEISKAIAGRLGDKVPEVREAAVKALGERGDEVGRRVLRGALKRFAKDEDLLPVVVTALGAAGDAGAAKQVAAIARKAVGRDARLARAAIDALGSMRAAESIACLVELLGAAEAAREGSGAGHAELREDLLDSLREVTGLPFKEPETYLGWWRHAKRAWRATPPGPPKEGRLYRDDAWRFSIERPEGDRWEFAKSRGGAIALRHAGGEGESGFARVEVIVWSALEAGPDSLADVSALYEKRLRGDLSRLKDADFGAKAKLGGRSAVRHEVTGITKGGRVLRAVDRLARVNDLYYAVAVRHDSGVSERVRSEVDGIVGSFAYLDR
jgi:hypothetical protein